MPRRHPKEDKQDRGLSPARLAERRERRERRRNAKSPVDGLNGGLLTAAERVTLNLDRNTLRAQLERGAGNEEILRQQLRNIELDLEADARSR